LTLGDVSDLIGSVLDLQLVHIIYMEVEHQATYIVYIVNSIFATPQHMIALKTTMITCWGVTKIEFTRLLATVVVFRHLRFLGAAL